MKSDEVIVINGPLAPVSSHAAKSTIATGPSIIYSVQLQSGAIVTSPDRFPILPTEMPQAKKPNLE